MRRRLRQEFCSFGIAAAVALVLVGAQPWRAAPAAAQASDAPHEASSSIDLTLSQAVALALRQNLDLRSARLNRIVDRLVLRIGEDKFTPKLALEASAGVRVHGEDLEGTQTGSALATLELPTGGNLAFLWSGSANEEKHKDFSATDSAMTAGITLIQPLLRGRGFDVGLASVRTARIEERISQLGLEEQTIQTIDRTIQLYRQYYQARQQVQIAEQGLASLEHQFEVNEALIAAGRLPPVDNLQTRQQIAAGKLGIISSRNAVDAARLALLNQLGLREDVAVNAVEPLDIRQRTVTRQRALDTALTFRRDWQIALLRIKLAQISLVLAKDATLPQVDLSTSVQRSGVGSHLRAAIDDMFRDPTEWRAMVTVNFPVFGDLTPELGETSARVNFQQAEIAAEQTERSIKTDVTDAVRDLSLDWEQYQLARQARELAEQQLAVEQEKLQVGRTSNFKVLSFQRTLTQARQAELQAIIEYDNALTRLDSTLGTTLQTWQVQ